MDKILLLIKNLLDKKLEYLYLGAFKVKKVLGVVDIKIFPKYYIVLYMKALLKLLLVTYQFY